MALRQTRDVHDIVLRNLVTLLSGKHGVLAVRANFSGERQFEVQGLWPDLVLLDDDGQPKAVYEIETDDTLMVSSTHVRWAVIAELGLPLHLVVPEDSSELAKALVWSLGLGKHVRKLLKY
jgi:hypothetical protein